MNEPRISKPMGVTMIVVAALIDFIQFSLDLAIIGFFVDTIISAVAGIFFGIWFSHLGVSFNKTNPLGFWSTLGAELVPVVNAAPWWTITVAYTVRQEWKRKTDI